MFLIDLQWFTAVTKKQSFENSDLQKKKLKKLDK